MGALVQLLPHHLRLRPAKGGSAPSLPCPWLPDRPAFRRITSLRLRSGPQSCSPLDQAHPLRGGRDFYARAFSTAGHPTAKSGITTQLSGPLLRRDLHPLGQCCYGLQLRSIGSPRLLRSYGSLRPCASPRYAHPSWVRHLEFSLVIEATGSHVPPKGLAQSHATSMPGVIQASCSLSLDRSRANDSARFRHHPYAFDTFPVVHPCSSL